ncbi:hypothetical protein HYV86_02275 [Candidatus Woesearchaeota archaeon]|nr:hypothetical protein [Candidatus Woesearchaeota archaeon]
MRMIGRLVVLIVIFVSLPFVFADTTISAVFPLFNSTNIQAFQINGNAALSGSVLRLTPATGNQAGSAFWNQKIYLTNNRSFSTYFSFKITASGSGGADGLVFVIQPQSNTAGSSGGGLGFEGINSSFGVEFDTYLNTAPTNDINGNHIGIDGSSPNNKGNVTSLASRDVSTINSTWALDDGAEYHAWVDYNGTNNSVEVRLNQYNNTRPALSHLNYTIDLETVFPAEVYIGFTAATGGSWNNHDITAFYFYNDQISSGINLNTTSYLMAPFRLNIFSQFSNLTANGWNRTEIYVNATDINNGTLANQLISFTTTSGIISPGSATTNSTGGVLNTLIASHSYAVATVRAIAVGGAFADVNVTFNHQSTVPEWSDFGLVLILVVVVSGFLVVRKKIE